LSDLVEVGKAASDHEDAALLSRTDGGMSFFLAERCSSCHTVLELHCGGQHNQKELQLGRNSISTWFKLRKGSRGPVRQSLDDDLLGRRTGIF